MQLNPMSWNQPFVRNRMPPDAGGSDFRPIYRESDPLG